MNSEEIKAALFQYFRFKKDFMICASEARVNYSGDIEDFVALDLDEIVVCEIKISKSDFDQDFKTKQKHKELSETGINKMYYAVPENISEYVKEKLKGTKFGVLVVSKLPDDINTFFGQQEKGCVKCIKSATLINPRKRLFDNLKRSGPMYYLLRRASSELANIHYRYVKEKQKNIK